MNNNVDEALQPKFERKKLTNVISRPKSAQWLSSWDGGGNTRNPLRCWKLLLDVGACYTRVSEHKYSPSLSPAAGCLLLSLSLSPNCIFHLLMLTVTTSLSTATRSTPHHSTGPAVLMRLIDQCLFATFNGCFKIPIFLNPLWHFGSCVAPPPLTTPHSPDDQLLLPPCLFTSSHGVSQGF